MNKTEILNIVNGPSKHIHIVKIDGKDSIVYSSKFVELLELIPSMLTKADMIAMLTEILLEAEENTVRWYVGRVDGKSDDVVLMETLQEVIQQKIDKLKEN